MPWYGGGCSALLWRVSAGWERRCLQPRGRAHSVCTLEQGAGKVAWQNRVSRTSLKDLMFLVIHCPSKAPCDCGAHSQRLTQPSPVISSFLQESSPWKDAALQEGIPGGCNHCTRSSPVCLWSKHLLFHLISNKWEAWVGGKESSTLVKYLLRCNVFYFGSGMEAVRNIFQRAP